MHFLFLFPVPWNELISNLFAVCLVYYPLWYHSVTAVKNIPILFLFELFLPWPSRFPGLRPEFNFDIVLNSFCPKSCGMFSVFVTRGCCGNRHTLADSEQASPLYCVLLWGESGEQNCIPWCQRCQCRLIPAHPVLL